MQFSQIPKNFASEYEMNLAIEGYVKHLQANKQSQQLPDSERDFLLRYTGKGQEFGKDNTLVTEGLYEFYTPSYLRELMWQLAEHYGFKGGNVLEPSCATGHMFLNAPTNTKLVGVEVNPITAAIAQLCFPKATIHNLYFEQLFLKNTSRPGRASWGKELPEKKPTWIKEYPFDLVIGNPPYGPHSGTWAGAIKSEKYVQVEFLFLLKGLALLKSGGLLVYLTSSNWLRNGNSYKKYKSKCASMATLVDAYRNPSVFKRSAVPTDVLVFKKL